MAVIYLRHPDHGAKVAISDMEAENDMANGWEEFDPTKPEIDFAPEADVIVEDIAPVEPEPVNELQSRRRARRPRKATQ